MRPMIRALMLAAVVFYGLGVLASGLLQATPRQLPLWVRLAPMAPLLMVAVATHFARRAWLLSVLMLTCVLLLQIGFNLN
ncbi:MAG: hypothetical protein M3Y93_02800 [Pseudomonadota bacterium]|nr:hypothetical protein [Pseudomonadota bacterium]